MEMLVSLEQKVRGCVQRQCPFSQKVAGHGNVVASDDESA